MEDDEPLRELAVRMLQDAGYQVTEATNAEYALDIMKASKPRIDLLLTDVIMPGKSGVELLEQAKVGLSESSFVIYFGISKAIWLPYAADWCRKAAFLEKPFTRRSLLVKVYAALHSESARRQ